MTVPAPEAELRQVLEGTIRNQSIRSKCFHKLPWNLWVTYALTSLVLNPQFLVRGREGVGLHLPQHRAVFSPNQARRL